MVMNFQSGTQPSFRRKLAQGITRARRFVTGVPGRSEPESPQQVRVRMTVSCRDCDPIPKVANAGAILEKNGVRVQMMHEGTLVRAGGYHGDWMEQIISNLRGHHEPQEELIFHNLVKAARPNTRMVELGAYWAYYTNWYLGAVPGSTAVCVEPDPTNLECGRFNLALNRRQARWLNACVGKSAAASVEICSDSNGSLLSVPCHNMTSLLAEIGEQPIEMLHIDVQGAELPFLCSLDQAVGAGLIRFVMVSTHHVSITGSASTHHDCLRALLRLGAVILCEHTVPESYSGDGFIAASFLPQDANLALPEISRNSRGTEIFSQSTGPGSTLELARTDSRCMLVDTRDKVIAGAILAGGKFEEPKIDEVTRFLIERYRFVPQTFVDLGANLGTHLIGALADGKFVRGVGVEMDRHNFALLKCNLILNQLDDRAQVYNVALSNQSGVATMELSPDNFGDHRIRQAEAGRLSVDDESARTTLSVSTTTLNELIAAHRVPISNQTLIWLDTQGHEGQILAGASCLLEQPSAPFLVLEFWPYGLERAGGKELLFRFLGKAQAIYDLQGERWMSRPPVTLEHLEREYERHLAVTTQEHHSFTDLLCIL